MEIWIILLLLVVVIWVLFRPISKKELDRYNAEFTISWLASFLFSKEWSSLHLYKYFASPIADAASVLFGPALIAFTLLPLDPKSLARYLTLDSSAALHTPITL